MNNHTPSAAAIEAAARLQGYSPSKVIAGVMVATDDAALVLRSDVAAALDAFARGAVERYVEALTPSGATKAAYHGEFKFTTATHVDDDGAEHSEKIAVPWTTVKAIMAAILNRAGVAP